MCSYCMTIWYASIKNIVTQYNNRSIKWNTNSEQKTLKAAVFSVQLYLMLRDNEIYTNLLHDNDYVVIIIFITMYYINIKVFYII